MIIMIVLIMIIITIIIIIIGREKYIYICIYTVQTFNSCTSRPDVCQCPVVHTPFGIMSKR